MLVQRIKIAIRKVRSIIKKWKREGLHVIYNGIRSTTKESALSHLQSGDIYKYAIMAHGDGDAKNGSIQFNDNLHPLRPGRKTKYKIAEMQLIVCWSNAGEARWRRNVSENGILVTYKGKIQAWRWSRSAIGGYPQNPIVIPAPRTPVNPDPNIPAILDPNTIIFLMSNNTEAISWLIKMY